MDYFRRAAKPSFVSSVCCSFEGSGRLLGLASLVECVPESPPSSVIAHIDSDDEGAAAEDAEHSPQAVPLLTSIANASLFA